MSFVSDEQASSALEWLMRHAKELGEAKKQAILTESMRKRVRAIEMAKSDAKTVADREREAEASNAYLIAIEDEANAAGHYEYMRALKDAATAKIECWRSLNATQRQLRAA
jgi:hypothetical protein